MLKFLIDECLSPQLAGLAHELGHAATHVNWLQLDGERDQVIAVYAVAADHILVTNNGVDFRPIYRALDVHPGLVVILPSLRRIEQIGLFEAVIRRLEAEQDLINKLVEIDAAGVISVTDLPPNRHNL